MNINELNKYKIVPKTIVADTYEEMSYLSAKEIAKQVNKKANSLISFAAGSTAKRTFELLKEFNDNNEVDFSKCYFVELDEWLDLDDESENCTSFMFKNFYDVLNIKKDKITLFNTHAVDFVKECERVDEVVASFKGIDLMLLGIGMNGHLGLNEPGDPIDTYSKIVNLAPITATVGQKYFNQKTNLTRGITLGGKHILETKKVILQAGGIHKAEIIKQLYLSPITKDLPATLVKACVDSVVILDSDAASLIL